MLQDLILTRQLVKLFSSRGGEDDFSQWMLVNGQVISIWQLIMSTEKFVGLSHSQIHQTNNQTQLVSLSLPNTVNIANHKTILSLQSGIDSKVTIVPGKSLVSDTLIAKLEAMDAEGEKNVINAVNESELAVDENRTLSIVSVSGSKIAELNLNEDFRNLSNNVDSLSTDLADLNNSLQSLNTNLTAYKIEVSQTYLTKSEFDDRFSWHELSDSVTT